MVPQRFSSIHRQRLAQERERAYPTPDLPDPVEAGSAEDVGARALQRRLRHTYERGEPEMPRVRSYPPGARLALLMAATGSLWWSIYAVARVAVG